MKLKTHRRVIHVPTGTTQRMKKDPHDFVGWVEAPCADTHRVRVRGGYRGAQPTLRFSNETQFEPIFIRDTEDAEFGAFFVKTLSVFSSALSAPPR